MEIQADIHSVRVSALHLAHTHTHTSLSVGGFVFPKGDSFLGQGEMLTALFSSFL